MATIHGGSGRRNARGRSRRPLRRRPCSHQRHAIEPLEPRQLLATYVWEPKNDGSLHAGYTQTNTGAWLPVSYTYLNNNDWTAPRQLSTTIHTAPNGGFVVAAPGNWNLPDFPDSANANVQIGAGRTVLLAGSWPISGAVAIGTLTNAGNLEIRYADAVQGDLRSGQLSVYGASLKNDGTIRVTSSDGSQGGMRIYAPGTTLSGGGTLTLTRSNLVRAGSNAPTLAQAATHAITGSGLINVLTANQGTISANDGGTLELGVASLTNSGTLQAVAGNGVSDSVLAIVGSGNTITNTGGTIRAQGDTSKVSLADVTVVGGTLATTGSGLIQVRGATTLESMTNSGARISVDAGKTLTIKGPMVEGVATVLGNNATLLLDDAAVAKWFTSTGQTVLQGGIVNRTGPGQTALVQSAGHSITGKGQILAALDNRGTISSDADGNIALPNAVTNSGTLQAANGGALDYSNGTIQNAGGTIRAQGDGSRVGIWDSTVVGGTLASTGTGWIQVNGRSTFDARTTAVKNTGSLHFGGLTSELAWRGAVVNSGTIGVNSSGTLILDSGATVTGAGAIALGGGTLKIAGSGVLSNLDNPISGTGAITGDAGASLSLRAPLTADGGTLSVGVPVARPVSGVTLSAVNGGNLLIKATPTGTGTISAIGKDSRVTLSGGAVITSATPLETKDSGSVDVDAGGASLDGSAKVFNLPTAMNVGWKATLSVKGGIVNTGTLTAPYGGTLAMNGAVTLSGGGTVLLGRDAGISIDTTLTNSNNTVAGVGAVGGAGRLINGGTFRADVNQESGVLRSGLLSVSTPVTNTGRIESTAGSKVSFTADVTNTGTIATAGDASFNTISHGVSGVQTAASGSVIKVGDFLNASTQAAAWNTAGATISFQNKGINHRFQLAGLDQGSAAAGWTNNFTWGGVDVAPGRSVSLESGRSSGKAAGYVGVVSGAVTDGFSTITNITGNGLNLYYDGTLAGNAYLQGKTYFLTGGGLLVPKGGVASISGSPSADSGDGQANLSWAAPVPLPGDPAVTDYVVQYSTDDGKTWTTVNDGVNTRLSAVIPALTNGTTYTFRVAAKYGGITSDFVSSYSLRVGVPAAPTGVTVLPRNGRAIVTWNPSVANGLPLTGYRVSYTAPNESGSTSVGVVTNLTWYGLTNGTSYTFRVAGTNPYGTGAFSSFSNPVIPSAQAYAPGQPSITGTIPGSGQVALSWSVPNDDGGAAITDYKVEYSSNGGTSWTTFTRPASASASATVTGLTNGTAYVFRVSAVNSAGTGALSANSGAVTPPVPAPIFTPTAGVTIQGVEFGTTPLGYAFRQAGQVRQVTYNGQNTSPSLPGAGWTARGVWPGGGGTYQVFWRGPNNAFGIWTLNSGGGYVSGQLLTPRQLGRLETQLNFDLGQSGAVGR